MLAFYIGNDLDSVIGNPIGQPMATVSQGPGVVLGMKLICMLDFLQQCRKAGNIGYLGIHDFDSLDDGNGLRAVYVLRFRQILIKRPSAHCGFAPAVRLFAGPGSAAVGCIV